MQEAFVQKKDGTAVGDGSYDTTGGLQHLIHTRVPVRIVEAGALFLVEIIAKKFVLRADHRKPGSNHDSTDQAAVLQVDSLSEDTAHNTKSDGCSDWCVLKMGQKLLAHCLTH